MARGDRGNFTTMEYLYFDPNTGKHLGTWHRGVNRSPGDWIVWLMRPLHHGVYWGLGVKIVWAAAGLCIPLLAVTGMLMYWNRALGPKWRQVRSAVAAGTSLTL